MTSSENTRLISVSACRCLARISAQKSSHEALEEVAKERLALVEKYQRCVQKSGNVEQIEACDSYLKAAEALK